MFTEQTADLDASWEASDHPQFLPRTLSFLAGAETFNGVGRGVFGRKPLSGSSRRTSSCIRNLLCLAGSTG